MEGMGMNVADITNVFTKGFWYVLGFIGYWVLYYLNHKYGLILLDWVFGKAGYGLKRALRPVVNKVITNIEIEEEKVGWAKKGRDGLADILIGFATKALFQFFMAATLGVLALILFLSEESPMLDRPMNYLVLLGVLALLTIFLFLRACLHIEKGSYFYRSYEKDKLLDYGNKLEGRKRLCEKLKTP
jgi:hypothetical protein